MSDYLDQSRHAFYRRNPNTQNFRTPRRATPPATEAVVLGRIKWFSPEKGFGFVALEDGTDVFLHGSTLERAGVSVGQGDNVRVGVGQGLKGGQVTEVLEVKPATSTTVEGRGPATGSVSGVVKWWNVQKGFGFVTPEAGAQDIFVHATIAARSGLDLEPGMPVRVKVRHGVKGPEATEIAAA